MSKTTSSEQLELFAASGSGLRDRVEREACDTCDQPIACDDGSEGYGIPGSGVYLWKRGDEVRLEKVPLCGSCAAAIGMTALARWEIEEEEG